MKVLYTTNILEFPPAGGPELRVDTSIKALSKIFSLHIIYRANYPSEKEEVTNHYYKRFAKVYTVIYKHPKFYLYRFISRVCKRLFQTDDDAYLTKIVRYLESNSIDVVWFGHGQSSYSLIKKIKNKLPNIKVVCDTDSVWSRFILRELQYSSGKRKKQILINGKKKQLEEKEWVKLCNVTTAVSNVDALYYQNLSNNPERIFQFSNVIEIENYKIIPKKPKNFKNPCIFLAGSFGPNSSMNMATNWILNEVLPIVRKNYPNLHFYIVGKNSDKEFGNIVDDNISVTGKVPSILPYLCHSNIAVVPLRFESGTRFKILEAAACKIPIVSTTLGAEGLLFKDKKHLLIADRADEFASSIIKILNKKSLREKMIENSYHLVKLRYDLSSLKRETKKILEYLKKN